MLSLCNSCCWGEITVAVGSRVDIFVLGRQKKKKKDISRLAEILIFPFYFYKTRTQTERLQLAYRYEDVRDKNKIFIRLEEHENPRNILWGK